MVSRQARGVHHLPLVLHWKEPDRPLPLRLIEAARTTRGRRTLHKPPSWLNTGTPGEPFDFCHHVRRLCTDIARRCTELSHIDTSRLLFGVTQARNGHS